MLDPEGAWLIASLILDAIETDKADLVGGLEMGAVPIASAVSAVSFGQGRPVRAFFVRKQAKEHGTQALLEGLARNQSASGLRAAILEDVTTTGGSALKAVEAVRASGAEITRVITIVDRQEGASATFATAGLLFTPLLTTDDFR